jgi:type VI secretion system protein ImpJ
MSYSTKILWGEGLFLRPQHFQRQDAYHEARLHDVATSLHPYSWGVQSTQFDQDALANGVLRATDLKVIFPDGELYSAPQADELPPSVHLDALAPGVPEMTFYLALLPMKDFGGNFTNEMNGIPSARYSAHSESTTDLFTDAAQAELTYLKKSVRLIADTEPRDQFVSVPVLRVRRTATGGFEMDKNFMAPSTSIRAAPVLYLQLRRLLDTLQAKVNALYGFHREPTKNVIEFRSGDIASFWLLHTASTSFAALSHLFQHPQLHPERLFQEMLRLAGALMTFSKSHTLADLPVYLHEEPGPGFAILENILRDLLETVISTRYFAINLQETKPSFHLGRLDSGKINDKTNLYLSVTADMPAVELVSAVPMRFKIGAPDDVEKFVLSAMPGVRLTHSPQVPPAIPVRPGAYYFAIDGKGPLHDRMLQAQSIMIYTPSGIPNLKLELVAVTA